MHGWGSNFMVAIVLIHMVQVFCSEPTNIPRTNLDHWSLSSVDDLGMAFTGQIMRFDQDAYWGWESERRSPAVFPSSVLLL